MENREPQDSMVVPSTEVYATEQGTMTLEWEDVRAPSLRQKPDTRNRREGALHLSLEYLGLMETKLKITPVEDVQHSLSPIGY